MRGCVFGIWNIECKGEDMKFCYIFFFFKQKTAYDMRISDWSSDVCSSDLHPQRAGGRDTAHGIFVETREPARCAAPVALAPGAHRPCRRQLPALLDRKSVV